MATSQIMAPVTREVAERPFSASRLEELRSALGQDSLDALLDMLAEELVRRPATITIAVADNDFGRAASEAHALAGAALSVGATAAGAAARSLEDAVRMASGGERISLTPALRSMRAAAGRAADALPALRHALSCTDGLAA